MNIAVEETPASEEVAVPAVACTGPGPGGIYARMADVGLGPENFRETLVCRMPTSAEVMALPRGTPVVAITRFAYTSTGRCVEVNEMVRFPARVERRRLLRQELDRYQASSSRSPMRRSPRPWLCCMAPRRRSAGSADRF